MEKYRKLTSTYDMESYFAKNGLSSIYHKALEIEHKESKHIDGRSWSKTSERLLLWWNQDNNSEYDLICQRSSFCLIMEAKQRILNKGKPLETISELKDKLRRRNMQIKELKKKIEHLKLMDGYDSRCLR